MSNIEMPGEDGYALIGKMRDLPDRSVASITAVAVTSHARLDALRALRDLRGRFLRSEDAG